MGGLGESVRGRLGVAHVVVPIEHQIAGDMVKQLRRAGGDRILRVGDDRQRLIFHLDRFGGVARGAQRLGDDERHRLADIADLAQSEQGTRRVVARRAIAIGERRLTGDIAKPIGGHVLAGRDEQHVRHAPCRRRVDALDARMRRRRAQHKGGGRPRQRHVVGVAPLPGDQTQIFMAPHRLPNGEFHAVPRIFRPRRYMVVRGAVRHLAGSGGSGALVCGAARGARRGWHSSVWKGIPQWH